MSSSRRAVRIGQFFFRYRNALFPVMFVVVVPILRPQIILGHPTLDHILVICGAIVAVAGELFRLATIGFQYIERGGKNKQIYASFLAQRGMYALTRNPMYVGNALIAIGMVMVAGSPLIYSLVLPFFLFVYWAIVEAEEAYLLQRFGSAYAQYCARVNRFVPSLRGARDAFAGIPYDWRRAIRKDLSTIAGLLTGLILLPVWRTFFLRGWAAAKIVAERAAVFEATVLALYWFLSVLKKRRRLFYVDEPQNAV